MTIRPRRVRRLVGPLFLDPVPRDHTQSDRAVLRRRVVSAVTLVGGTVLLGLSLAVRPGDARFYPMTLAVAATWVVGGLLSGPLHLGHILFRDNRRRPVLTPIAVGVAVGAVFIAAALVVRQIPPGRDYVASVLAHARRGSPVLIAVVTLVNGAAEEVFFRGAVYAAIGRRYPVPICTAIYTLATVATGNPMLVVAAAILGTVLALQRRASGGILAPLLTHLTWSMIMLYVLQPLFPG